MPEHLGQARTIRGGALLPAGAGIGWVDDHPILTMGLWLQQVVVGEWKWAHEVDIQADGTVHAGYIGFYTSSATPLVTYAVVLKPGVLKAAVTGHVTHQHTAARGVNSKYCSWIDTP